MAGLSMLDFSLKSSFISSGFCFFYSSEYSDSLKLLNLLVQLDFNKEGLAFFFFYFLLELCF